MNIKCLPSLSSYTVQDIQKAEALSPALRHYRVILTKAPRAQEDSLRIERNKIWCEAAAATILNSAAAQDICWHWSNTADRIAQSAWKICGCAERDMALFALGKWGSQELNLSSDIDIIFVTEKNPTADDFACARRFIHIMSELTEFGFCFRVDTDLKPGGRLSPLISSVQQFENYYWASGATWERLALVRLRAVIGPASIRESIAQIVDRFVFRKFLDFSLLQDLQLLRSQIHGHYPQTAQDKINLKLAPGGIRDIELFIHALQVIHGGKTPSLRTTSTTHAAKELVRHKRFNGDSLKMLIDCYWRFRQLENYVQAIADQQTHEWTLNHGKSEFDQFQTSRHDVEKIVESVLGQSTQPKSMPVDQTERESWLRKLGYTEETIASRIPQLLNLSAVSARTYQDEELRLKVIAHFLEQIAEVALDKDLGIALLVDFIRATRVKSGFFSLLLHEHRLIRELSLLFGCSPYLGGLLAQRPELLDSYLYRAHGGIHHNSDHLYDDLLEQKLLNEIITATAFLNSKNVCDLGLALTAGADEVVLHLLRTLKNEISPASQVHILALGKWGGSEMGFHSDLDFIFVTPERPHEEDQKIARRFLTRLTERHKGGSIYNFDMRLRPSGKAGPILVSLSSLLDYLRQAAGAWERQSYLKCRWLGDVPDGFTTAIYSACIENGITENQTNELAQIRISLLRPNTNEPHLKFSPGGLVDIEFAIQIEFLSLKISPKSPNTLEQLEQLRLINSDWQRASAMLSHNYQFLRTVEQLSQLVNQHSDVAISVDSDGFQRVCKILNAAPDELFEKIQNALSQNLTLLKPLDLRQRAQ